MSISTSHDFFPILFQNLASRTSTLGGIDFANRVPPNGGIASFGLCSDEKTFIEERLYHNDKVAHDITPTIKLTIKKIQADSSSYSLFSTLGSQTLLADRSLVTTEWFKEILLLTAVAEIDTSLYHLKKLRAEYYWGKHREALFSAINGKNNFWSLNGLIDIGYKAFLCIDNSQDSNDARKLLTKRPSFILSDMCGISWQRIPIPKTLQKDVASLALRYLQGATTY